MRRVFLSASALAMLGAALFLLEGALRKAEENVINAHQARVNCLTEQSEKTATCRSNRMSRREDFDYCPEAVNDCKKNGFYRSVQIADDELKAWNLRVGVARVVALMAVSVLAFRVAGRQVIGRWRYRPRRERSE